MYLMRNSHKKVNHGKKSSENYLVHSRGKFIKAIQPENIR